MMFQWLKATETDAKKEDNWEREREGDLRIWSNIEYSCNNFTVESKGRKELSERTDSFITGDEKKEERQDVTCDDVKNY